MAKKYKEKKVPNRVWLFTFILIASTFYGLWSFYKYNLSQKSAFTFYKNFGIELPNQYTIHGIDVSKHQSIINWNNVQQMKVKNVTISFAFIKATEGILSKDFKFNYNWQQAKLYNLTRGSYHYFLPNKSASLQASNFIKSVTLQKGDLPPVLDIEDLAGTSPKLMRQRVKEYLTLLERHYKVRPIIYSYANFYENYLGDEFKDYPLWIAHYKEKQQPNVSRSWHFWQHSEEGRVNGITSKVDFNVFNGDTLAFKQLLLK